MNLIRNLFKFLSMVSQSYNAKFKELDLKIKFYKKIKAHLETCEYPDYPQNINLEVHNSDSIMVTFDEPAENPSIITKYLGKIIKCKNSRHN